MSKESFAAPFGARLQALCEWLRLQGPRIDEAGCIPPDVMQRLHELDLFRITLPASQGGLGMDAAQAWPVAVELARSSPSVGWVVSLCVVNTIIALRLPQTLRGELLDGDAPLVMSVLVGVPGREVESTHESGGLRLSGCWDYASGIDVSGWVALLVPPQTPGPPDLALIPRSAFEVDAQSWQVLGLRGTGSKSCRLVDVFVPSHRLAPWPAVLAGVGDSPATDPAALPGHPLIVLLTMSVLAPLLGVAQATADSFERLLRHRIGADRAWRDPYLSTALARSRATIEMAIDGLVSLSARLLATSAASGSIDDSERAAARMRLLLMAEQARDAAQELFGLAGGRILPSGTAFESLFRDLHAMASHRLLQMQPVAENTGRLWCGLEPLPGTRL